MAKIEIRISKSGSTLSLFSSFELSGKILKVIEELGFSKMTSIQEKSIGPLLEGRDLIGQSKTGSGKTFAFSIPILQKIVLEDRAPQALIICPTRELSAQVVQEIRKLARNLSGLQVLLLSGGQPARPQAESLRAGVHIVVGTSGRLLDLIDRGALNTKKIKVAVMDEADKLLEMGFADEISAIMNSLPAKRQTVFFSATFQPEIEQLSRHYQTDPLRVIAEDQILEKALIREVAYEIGDEDRSHLLLRVLAQHPAKSTLIFCNQKLSVDELVRKISAMGVSCAAIHGDLEQRDRSRVLTMFRNGSYRILVATDVAARGIDIDHLDLVVNFDFPSDVEAYTHRIGRTGRAGREGVAVTLVSMAQDMKLFEIERVRGVKILRPTLGFKNQYGLDPSHKEASMRTLSISGGRKDKLRPGDILGALTGEVVALQAANIGKIDIQDKNTLVAVASEFAERAAERLRVSKIKGRKFQVRIV